MPFFSKTRGGCSRWPGVERGFAPLDTGSHRLRAGDERRIASQLNRSFARPGRDRAGFTLPELLVVMAIIGLLATMVITIAGEARAKSRDARREADIKTLQTALTLYVINNSAYPTAGGGGVCLDGADTVSSQLMSGGVISTIPVDPRHDCSTAVHYHYTSTDGSTYSITYSLETNTILGKNAGLQPPVTP